MTRYDVQQEISLKVSDLKQLLDDDLRTDSFDEATDFAHERAMSGDYVRIKNVLTGDEKAYTPDEWEAAVDLGGYPDSVNELA